VHSIIPFVDKSCVFFYEVNTPSNNVHLSNLENEFDIQTKGGHSAALQHPCAADGQGEQS
jgi:hypothetical protein